MSFLHLKFRIMIWQRSFCRFFFCFLFLETQISSPFPITRVDWSRRASTLNLTFWEKNVRLGCIVFQLTNLFQIQSHIWPAQRARKLQGKLPAGSWQKRWAQICTWWFSCQTCRWTDQQQSRRERSQRKSWMIQSCHTTHAHTPNRTVKITTIRS